MRVLHILCDLSGGGAERLVLEMCRRRAPDISVEVATVMGFGPLEADFRDVAPIFSAGRTRRHLGIRAVARLVPLVRRADVVHTHLFAGDTWGRIAAAITGHPAVVTTEHNIDRDETWQRPIRELLAPIATTVAVSEAVARASPAADTRVIANGIDLARFTAPHRGGSGILGVGRLVPQKGFDVLARAVPAGVRVRIAGEGAMRIPHPDIEWLGRRENVPDLLAAADILVVPSRWEGFGIAALEGMAAGVPVVASNVDGLAELVGNAGVLVPPGDAPALHDALTALLADPARRADLSQKGRERAAGFGIDRTVQRYESLYRTLVDGIRSRPPSPSRA